MHNQTQAFYSYVSGFILSLILTIGAYVLVVEQSFNSALLIVMLVCLALLQLSVQLYFFLHIGRESKPRWNLIFFISTFGILVMIVVGSIWIMDHLNYNMSAAQMNQQLIKDEGITR